MAAGGQVNITIADSGSATIVVPGTSTQLVIGCATAGTPNTIVATRNPSTLQLVFAGGPLPEAAALTALAGGTVLAMRAATTTPGALRHPNSVAVSTTTGSAVTPIVVTTTTPHGLTTGDIVTIAGVTGNTAANGTFPVTVVDTTHFSIPATGSGAYVSGGTVAWGGVVYVGTGSLVPTVTLDATNGAWDDFYVSIKFLTPGTIGTAGITFQVSVDAGRNYGPTIALGTATTYTIGSTTGITLNFTSSQTVVAGDTITFSTIAPTWSDAGIQACLNAFAASAYGLQGVGSIHIVGVAAGADATTIQGYLDTLAANFVAQRAIISARDASPPNLWGGTAETESTWMNAIQADYLNVTAKRLCGCAAYWNMPSAFPNTAVFGAPRFRRSVAWALAARQVVIPPQRHAGRVRDGALTQIVVDATKDPLDGFVYHDERNSPGLDYKIAGAGGRFCSTISRAAGIFISNPLLLSALGSDFDLLPKGNVIDITYSIVRQTGSQEIDDDVRTNPNGTIYENDAQAIERLIGEAINAAQFNTKQISQKAIVTVDRTANVQSLQAVNVAVQVVGRGYVLTINATIGFQNPLAAS